MSLSVYVAGPYHSAGQVRDVHETLRSLGIRPTSSWAERASGAEDWSRHSLEELRRAVAQNAQDVDGADVLFLYDPAGEGRETYLEAGRALAMGKPVVWLSHRGISRWGAGATVVESLPDALFTLGAMNAKHADGLRGELLAMSVAL